MQATFYLQLFHIVYIILMSHWISEAFVMKKEKKKPFNPKDEP